MLTIDTSNLHAVSDKHGLSVDYLSAYDGQVADYLEKIHAREQGFYGVIDDMSVVEKIEEYAASVKDQFEHIVVGAIGGSSLGTICLQQSLGHLFKQSKPALHVIDNIDPIFLAELDDVIDYEKTLFIIVTKSGGTPETLSEYFYFRKKCDEKGLPAEKHFVFVTDPEKGLLREISNRENIKAFDVPPNVGGRFSVLTPVGLLPAALIGIDIRALLKGAQDMRDKFLSENASDNPPFQMAVMQYELGNKGKVMNVLFSYSQKLIRFTDWYRQLLAESIGKRVDNNGNEVFTGLTPINALGVTDQHSQSQLYNEGPNDKFFIFLATKSAPEIMIPNLEPEKIPYLKDVSFKKLLDVEMEATAGSLTQNDRPNVTITLEKVDEHALGALFMLFEGATAFLGDLYNINAFDQPGVELSKTLTKEKLN